MEKYTRATELNPTNAYYWDDIGIAIYIFYRNFLNFNF